jgi:hypothetical protein
MAGEGGVVANRVEVGVVRCPLARARVVCERGAEVLERLIAAVEAGGVAGERVVDGAVVGVRFEPLGNDRVGALEVAVPLGGNRGVPVLEGRGRHRCAGLPAQHEHGRRVLGGDGLALGGGLDEQERAGGRVELLAGDGEGRPARRDDVELFVPPAPGPVSSWGSIRLSPARSAE